VVKNWSNWFSLMSVLSPQLIGFGYVIILLERLVEMA